MSTDGALGDDPESLERFRLGEWPRLVGALTLYTGDAALAEELAQEIVARVPRPTAARDRANVEDRRERSSLERELDSREHGLRVAARAAVDDLSHFRALRNGVRPGTARPVDCVNRRAGTITVPDVVGMRLGPAIRAIESAGLLVVGYGTPPSDPIERTSRVRVTKPSAGERAARGACVGLRTG